ncbi:MAG: hypothetical protein ACRENN_02150 [Candidatus Eiseniibacteriota bacterium]
MLQSAAMALEGVAPPAGRPGLLPIGTYLRAVIALGVGSLRAAPLAIGILYCYQLGMELILSPSSDASSPLGGYDSQRFILSTAIQLVAYLPMLVLIYTPFLPLQDGILRGERRTFFDCVQLVLERLPQVFLSILLQLTIAVVPPSLVLGGIAAALKSLPTRQEPWQAVVIYTAMVPCFLWIATVGFFLIYAIPLLVLERRGPLTSIRLSFSLVAHQFSGILGRLFVFLCLFILAAIALSMPEAMLQAWSSVTRSDNPAIRVARAIWSAGVSAIMFPLSVAALMLLFRSSVPATGITLGRPGPPEEPAPVASPFRFE